MDLKSLEKRIKKISDYAGLPNYKGKMFSELGAGIPFKDDISSYSEDGILIHTRNPAAPHMVSIFLRWKSENISLNGFLNDSLELIKPKGDNNCSFCSSKSSEVYKIKKGLFSSDNISFCILCQTLIDDKYIDFNFFRELFWPGTFLTKPTY